MDFHIGQDIVCIKSHSEGIVKEGEIYTVKGLKIDGCTHCNVLVIDVGIPDNLPPGLGVCIYHRNSLIVLDGKWWFCAKLFKPLDELTNISELLEVLEEPAFK